MSVAVTDEGGTLGINDGNSVLYPQKDKVSVGTVMDPVNGASVFIRYDADHYVQYPATQFTAPTGTASAIAAAIAAFLDSGADVSGSGTTNYIPKWTASTTLGNSLLFDNGTSVLMGGTTAIASAQFAMTSTTQGFLMPRLTTAQKDLVATPATGLLVFDTTLGLFSYYTGAAWASLDTGTNDYTQGGNAFATTGTLGLTDANTLNIITNNITRIGITSGGNISTTQSVATTGSPTALLVTPGAHTTLTAAEVVDVNYALNRTVQFTGLTGFATQRAFLIQPPTYAFTLDSGTITTAATLAISGAPASGTNSVLTNTYGILIQAGAVAPGNIPTRSYGLSVNAQTGATSNYAANFLGGFVGVGIAIPTSTLHVVQAVATSGSPTALLVTSGAHTTLATTAEAIGVNFNLAATKQWAAGAITTQREFLIQAPTYAFDGASTITTAATVAITGAPIAGTNATLTNSIALWVQSGETMLVGSGTGNTTYGLRVHNSTGTNNALVVRDDGFVGIGVATPTPGAGWNAAGDIFETSKALAIGSGSLFLSRTAGANYLDYENSNNLNIRSIDITGGSPSNKLTFTGAGLVNIGDGSDGYTSAFRLQLIESGAGVMETMALSNENTATTGDGSNIYFKSRSSNTTSRKMASISNISTNIGDSTFAGDLYFSTAYAGVLGEKMRLTSLGNLSLTQSVATSGTPTFLTFTSAAHTTLATTAEDIGVNFNLSATKQWATGAITTQREFLIQAPTYAFVGASTITTAATVAISGAPIAGTNATLTNTLALWVQSGETRLVGSGTDVTTFGLRVYNSTPTLRFAVYNSAQISAGDGGANIFMGISSGLLISGNLSSTSIYNTAFGYESMVASTTGNYNTSLGALSLRANQSADQNTAIGYNCLNANTAAGNTGVGASALRLNTTGTLNTAVGNGALDKNSSGNNNCAFGVLALGNLTGANHDNVAMGYNSSLNNLSGDQNTSLGNSSGYSNSAGSGSVFLGYSAGYYETASNKLFIDNAARTDEATARIQSMIYGVFSTLAAGTQAITFNANTTIAQFVATSGTPTAFTVTGAAHTTLATTVESIGANFNMSATKQWAAGAITTQREVLIQAPTYAFASASTITTAATLAISAAPIAGTNATITNRYAAWIQSGSLAFSNVGAPAAAAADTIQIFAVDASAGNASLGLNTEAAVVTETVVSDRTLVVTINGTVYKICLKV